MCYRPYSSRIPVAVIALALIGMLTTRGVGDFVLTGDQTKMVTTTHSHGELYGHSLARIVAGGKVTKLYAFNTSTMVMSGGSQSNLFAYDTSTVSMSSGSSTDISAYDTSAMSVSGGSATSLVAYDSSTLSMSGGSANFIDASGTSTVSITGGSIGYLYAKGASTIALTGGSIGHLLYAKDTSTITFYAQNCTLGSGLSLDDRRVLGIGILSGEWSDGTDWSVDITTNDSGATILLIPEPATLSLVALGGLAMLRRKQR